jgi:hypothetical protein
MIGLEMFEEVVESLMALRVQEQAALDVMDAKLKKAGFWWPGVQAPAAHQVSVKKPTGSV